MKLYNKEKKEILELEIELAMANLSRCISFVLSLKADDKTYYDAKQLFKEFMIIYDLKDDLDYSMDCEEDMEVCDADYLLLKKWGWLNLHTYKTLSNIEE